MAVIKMRQGDSFPIMFELTQDNTILTPELIADVEVHLGDEIERQYSDGNLGFATDMQKWWFVPAQEETLAAEPGTYQVEAKVKYYDGCVQSLILGQVKIYDAICEEVI